MFNISKQQVLDAFHFRSACRSYDPNKKSTKKIWIIFWNSGVSHQALSVLNRGNF